jgi:hypothetical protein
MSASPSPSTTKAQDGNAIAFVFPPSDRSAVDTSFPDFSSSHGTTAPTDADSRQGVVSEDPDEPDTRNRRARRSPSPSRRHGPRKDRRILGPKKNAGIQKEERGRTGHRRTSSVRDVHIPLLQALSVSERKPQDVKVDHHLPSSSVEEKAAVSSKQGKDEDPDHLMQDCDGSHGPEEMSSKLQGLGIGDKTR